MANPNKRLAGLPLSSWLGFLAAVILLAAVIARYNRTHEINWMPLTAAAFLVVASLLMAKVP